MPVEAYNSIRKVEQYHGPLYRAYEILINELLGINRKVLLQIIVKVINDSIGLDRIVLTLLVFRAYPWLIKDSPPLPSITERTEAIYKAIKEVRRIYIERQVKDVLVIQNELYMYKIHELLL